MDPLSNQYPEYYLGFSIFMLTGEILYEKWHFFQSSLTVREIDCTPSSYCLFLSLIDHRVIYSIALGNTKFYISQMESSYQ